MLSHQESASNSISMMHTRRGAPAYDKTPADVQVWRAGVFGAGAAGGSERSDRVSNGRAAEELASRHLAPLAKIPARSKIRWVLLCFPRSTYRKPPPTPGQLAGANPHSIPPNAFLIQINISPPIFALIVLLRRACDVHVPC
jgi:hypothetical protein